MNDSDERDPDTVPDEDEIFTCWCGASGRYEELFDTDCLDETCGGLRELHCYCGGDFCVCHHHGSTECPGCEDCEGEADDYHEEHWDDQDYED